MTTGKPISSKTSKEPELSAAVLQVPLIALPFMAPAMLKTLVPEL